MTAQAKFATPRDPSRRTDGAAIAVLSDALGKPLMPWQRQVVDVAGERMSNGDLAYEIVIVTVPRQSGKTTLLGPVMLHRALINPGARVFYTAQTQKDANSRMEDVMKLLKGSPLDAPIANYQRSPGKFGVRLPNDAVVRTFAPVESALHGETPPLVVLDEFWEYDEPLGDALLEGAIFPAQLQMQGNRQVWLVSTAGTAASTFMRKWVERGRESTTTGKHPRIAYFEWSLLDGDDPYEPESLERFHPAIGNVINGKPFTAQSLLSLPDMTHAKWLRGICNVWTEAADLLISAEDYADLVCDPAEVPARSDVVVTYEIALENAAGVVMASWRDSSGAPCSRVIHAAPGTSWMHEFIVDVYRQWKPAILGADDGGPTRRLTDELRRVLGEEAVVTIGGREYGTACESWLTFAREKDLRLDGTATLRNGTAHLVLKRTGDVVSFSRKDSTGPIHGPIASAVGLYLYDHMDAPSEPLFIGY